MVRPLRSNEHPVLSFAKAEMLRLLDATGLAKDERLNRAWIGTWEELKNSNPPFLDDSFTWQDSGCSDDFFIKDSEDELVLAGKSERAALYAVYQYAQEVWGLHLVYPGEAPSVLADSVHFKPAVDGMTSLREPIRWFAPRMERRGFVFETINDPPYLIQMIDWFGHNKINEMFFTFTLWDQVGAEITPELIKRGIMVTLGGHSMKFFLNKEENKAAIAAANHPYTAKAQLNFQDHTWQEKMFQDITAYCKTVPNLSRISLWPEDIADKQTTGFLTHYIKFTERLGSYLEEAEVDVEVEHIAYNAGLAWNMLELEQTNPSKDVNTLFAYWGRDYSYGYEESPHDSDQRARIALEDWTARMAVAKREFTIFEYYSDHYMLSNLFPFLSKQILEDIAYYEKLHISRIVNLVVPYRGEDPYPWKWVHGFNSYLFSQAVWTDNLEQILDQYYSYYPSSQRASVRALFELIEEKLSGLSYWNVQLFPARMVDPEMAKASREQKEAIVASLIDVRDSVQSAIENTQLRQDSAPYQYGQHIVNYAESLIGRWMQ